MLAIQQVLAPDVGGYLAGSHGSRDVLGRADQHVVLALTPRLEHEIEGDTLVLAQLEDDLPHIVLGDALVRLTYYADGGPRVEACQVHALDDAPRHAADVKLLVGEADVPGDQGRLTVENAVQEAVQPPAVGVHPVVVAVRDRRVCIVLIVDGRELVHQRRHAEGSGVLVHHQRGVEGHVGVRGDPVNGGLVTQYPQVPLGAVRVVPGVRADQVVRVLLAQGPRDQLMPGALLLVGAFQT